MTEVLHPQTPPPTTSTPPTPTPSPSTPASSPSLSSSTSPISSPRQPQPQSTNTSAPSLFSPISADTFVEHFLSSQNELFPASTSNPPLSQAKQKYDLWEPDPSLLIPLDPSPPKTPQIYTLTSEQLYTLCDSYLSAPLPSPTILFPWLHGVDGRNYQQNLFFGIRKVDVPRHRGLTIVHADDGHNNRSQLIGSVFPNEILTSGTEGGTFLNLIETDAGINLRNFKIQVARYASISDIVVYGDDFTRVLELAEIISRAQQKLREVRLSSASVNASKLLTYRTYCLIEPFSKLESLYPDLVSIDSHGIPINKTNFWEQEREEMRILTTMSEITEGVWLGNTADVPVPSSKGDVPHNPYGINICIESHDLADMPSAATLSLASETLDSLPVTDTPTEILHFDCLASGVNVQSVPRFEIFWISLLGLLRFMEKQLSLKRRILLHCSDGYTETSLLALSWLIYHKRLRLPDAYLCLQKTRSFFVYSSDLEVLKRIESKVWALFEAERLEAERKKRGSVTLIKRLSGVSTWSGFGGSENMEGLVEGLGVKVNRRLHRKKEKKDLVERTNSDFEEEEDEEMEDAEEEEDEHFSLTHPHHHETRDHRQLLDDQYITTTSRGPSPEPIPEFEDPTDLHAWFHHPRFEGSFPSRVLPNLYLGNLNHATNPSMLRALGITHVLSVGENANLPTSGPDAFKVLHLDNLYDDGIDLLLPHLPPSLDFIEAAIAENKGVLVHCRVGVSRSATITIAYVMKALNKSLIDAYLFVRARRLNVIIQPNLKFMYELCQWEEKLRKKRKTYWGVLGKEIQGLNICYREV